jgi:ATP-binding cassette subfamily C protein CydC
MLARALLAAPAVLILDEPAAHLDPDARAALTSDLLAATAGQSTLLITHDLEGLDQVDEVIVLSRGRVVERGSHDDLLALNGMYRRMHESCQARPDAVTCGTAVRDSLTNTA